jgi:hypothetical protein
VNKVEELREAVAEIVGAEGPMPYATVRHTVQLRQRLSMIPTIDDHDGGFTGVWTELVQSGRLVKHCGEWSLRRARPIEPPAAAPAPAQRSLFE